MNNEEDQTWAQPSATLRQHAEAVLCGQPVELKTLSTEDVQALVHELKVHQLELEILHELDEAILSALPLEAIAQTALHRMRDLVPFQRASVVLYDFANAEATILAAWTEGETTQGPHTRSSLAMFRDVESRRTAEIRRVEDMSNLPQPGEVERLLRAEGIRAYFSVPLLSQDELFGELNVGYDRPGPFAAKHVEITKEIAGQLAVAIRQDRLWAQGQLHAVELEQQVTERTAELRQERNFIAAVLDTAGALMVVLDTGGRIIRFNKACERTSGYTFDEVKGRPFWELFLSPEENGPVRAVFTRLRAGQFPNEYENYWLTRDGRRRLVTWSNTALLDQAGAVEYIISIGIDITERRRAEESLRESEARLNGIISTATDAIITVDAAQRIILFNAAAEQVFDYTAREVVGQPLELLLPKRFHEVHRLHVRQFGQTGVTAREMGQLPGQLRGKRANGQEFPIEAMISQVEVAGQKLYTVILRDISQRQQLEQEKAQLFEAVNRQRNQLRALTNRLAEVQEAERKELARELHDQLGRDLSALDLNLSVIQTLLAETTVAGAPLQARLADSLALVKQMGHIIRVVMANLRPPVLDDYGLVAALRWYGAELATRVPFSITVQGEALAPRLPAPVELAFFRIAQEALTNIAKHAQAHQASITVAEAEGLVHLVIHDDGLGFDPDQRADPVDRQSWGLITMAERAEAVGATCRVESVPGQGTQVIVEIARPKGDEQ